METATKRGYAMSEACDYLGGISRQTMYRLLGDGQLSSYHIGVRRYFTKDSLDQLIDQRIGLFPELKDMLNHDLAGGSSDYIG